MPYYVYAVHDSFPVPQLEPRGEHAAFKDASAAAKALRAQLPAEARTRIKVMFADNTLAAEDLLLQVRAASGAGDDDA